MTRDELGKELKLLLAFAKIVVLDREIAEQVMRDWLRQIAQRQPIDWMTRREIYLSLAAQLPRAAQRPSASSQDPLRRLRRYSGFMRAFLFLTGPAGFAVEFAEEICDRTHVSIGGRDRRFAPRPSCGPTTPSRTQLSAAH